MLQKLFRAGSRPAGCLLRTRPQVEYLENRNSLSSVTLDPIPAEITVGQPITLTAFVEKGPGDTVQPGNGQIQGSVRFEDNLGVFADIPVTAEAGNDIEGMAQITFYPGVGTHNYSAHYTGDANFGGGRTSPSDSNIRRLVVDQPATAPATATSSTPSSQAPPTGAHHTTHHRGHHHSHHRTHHTRHHR